MQNLNQFSTTGLSLQLFHVQTNTAFDIPPNLTVIRLGKSNDQNPPDIDFSSLPNAEVVSRAHAQIIVENGNYLIEDLGSSNGTFVNDVKLDAGTRYQLTVGDRINFGQGDAITFIWQNSPALATVVHSTQIVPPPVQQKQPIVVDKTTKLIGLSLIVASIVLLTANVRIGIFFGLPSIALCFAGIFVLCQQRINRHLGWILIAIGILIIIFTGRIFASVNLLLLIATSTLFFIGYLLFTTGKILGYDWRSLPQIINK
ncbi:FHA domain-containing protein [Aulosira sp. FACHB-615]|uniref:FHA domain-containing protein n=1 Tax=Aulosira sp. FACHB-615 TaxID=2692777 RepID=UPI001685534A|nr:FHA domain-containing protein [Aulosira sp. FACHB-615]MBD2492282.1 FHA domain-containing protein [Aulosira sp. FACHB-615]